jgi:hypothetical protein
MKFFNKKIIFLTSLLTCGSLFGIVFLNTSCSHISKTINPFYSSFENNDPIALQNAEVISPININTLQTKVTAGPSRGYGTHTGFGYSGLKSFSYEARYINNQTQTKFSNYIYRNLNVIVGKDTEFSYKIFPNFADNTDDDYLHNLNFIATYASVDLLYNNNDSSTSLKSLAATHIKDINGNGLSPHEQGAAKSLFSYQ